MTAIAPAASRSLAVTDAVDRAIYAWADATTDATSERRDDLIRDKTRAVADGLQFIGKHLDQITPDDVKRWQADLERHLAQATVYATLSRLSSFYRWAAKDPVLGQHLTNNPVRLAMPKAPQPYQTGSAKALDDRQVSELLAQASLRAGKSVAGRRDYAMLVFYLLTGMRREEVAALRWGDLEQGPPLRVTARLKGGKVQTIEVQSPKVWAALRAYLTISGRLDTMTPESPLWTRHDRAGRPGKRLSSGAFVKNLKRMAALAGLEHIHLHQTRHTYARIVAEESGSMSATQEALGHENLATTRVYVKRVSVRKDRYGDKVAERLKIG